MYIWIKQIKHRKSGLFVAWVPINQQSSPTAKTLRGSHTPAVNKSLGARPVPPPPACQPPRPSPSGWPEVVPFLRKGTPLPCIHFFKRSCFLAIATHFGDKVAAAFPSSQTTAANISVHVCSQQQHLNCDGTLNRDLGLCLPHTAKPDDDSGFKVVTSE